MAVVAVVLVNVSTTMSPTVTRMHVLTIQHTLTLPVLENVKSTTTPKPYTTKSMVAHVGAQTKGDKLERR